MKRFTVALVVVAAVVAGLGFADRTAVPAQAQESQANSEVLLIEPKLCTVLLVAFNSVDSTTAATTCVALQNNLQAVAGYLTQSNGRDTPIIDPALTDEPDTPENEARIDQVCEGDTNDDGEVCRAGDLGVDDETEVMSLIDLRDDGKLDGKYRLRPEDFAAIDLDGDQLHEDDGVFFILNFAARDDDPVRTEVKRGRVRWDNARAGQDEFICGSQDIPDISFFDEDCDGDNEWGDGVRVLQLFPGIPPADLGPDTLKFIEPDGVSSLEYTIVGELDKIDFTLLKTVTTAGTAEEDCTFSLDVAGVTAALGNPHIALVLVRALDREGTQITGALFDWEVADPDKAFTYLPTTPTVDLGGFGKGFPQAICGADETGVVEVTAMLSEQASTIDPGAQDEDASFEVTVLGEPATLDIVSTPAQLACDGIASAELAVTLKDADGALVADGTEVAFDVKVLGTAKPAVAGTEAGVAKTKITPLAEGVSGVPVLITAGDLQASFLVKCGAPLAQPTPPGGTAGPGGAPGGAISGPDTGSGGALGNADGAGAMPVWPAVALLVGAMALIGARVALRRAS